MDMTRELDYFPIEVRIENTVHCNAHCCMCPREKLTRKKGFMGLDTFKNIIDQSVGLGVKSIHVHGFGEPLLDKYIFDKIAYASIYDLKTYMVTNGSLLDEEKAIKLCKSGLSGINITFSGMKKNTYESICKGLNFESTLNNVLSFFKTKEKLGSKTPNIYLTFVFQEKNQDEKEKFLETFQDLADDIKISPVHNYGDGKKYHKVEKTIDRISCGDVFFLHAFQILWDGRVVPCCLDVDGEIVFGNVHEKSLIDIWQGKKFVQFRKNHLDKKFENYRLCDNCEQLNKSKMIKRKFHYYRNKKGKVVVNKNAW